MHRIAALLAALAVLTSVSPAAAAVRSDSTLQDKLANPRTERAMQVETLRWEGGRPGFVGCVFSCLGFP